MSAEFWELKPLSMDLGDLSACKNVGSAYFYVGERDCQGGGTSPSLEVCKARLDGALSKQI